LILATARGGSGALSGERVEFVARGIGKVAARREFELDPLAKIGCELDGEREATYITVMSGSAHGRNGWACFARRAGGSRPAIAMEDSKCQTVF